MPTRFGFSAARVWSVLAAAAVCCSPAFAVDRVMLTVIDQQTNKPIEGATVQVFGGDAKAMATTDAAGSAAVLPNGVKQRYLRVTVSAPGYSPMRAMLADKGQPLILPEKFTLGLPRATTIGGRVVDAEGKPVEGAKVSLEIRTDGLPTGVSSGIAFKTYTTDAAGDWALDEAPPAWSSINVGVYHLTRGGWDRGFYEIKESRFEESGQALLDSEYVLTLPPVRVINGRVVDEAGKPILGVSIGIGEDRVGSNALPTAKTDADGKYAIGGVPDRPITLTFTAKGRSPELVRIQNKADLGEVTQTLQPGKTLTGQVVDAAGKPVPGARLYMDTWRGARTLSKNITADAEGRFVWNDAPADELAVSVMAAGHAALQNVAMTAGGPDVVVKLGKPVLFHATVVDAETKAPIKEFKAIMGIQFNDNSPPSFQRDGSESDGTAKDGVIEMAFSYPYPKRIVRVEADGYAPADSKPITMTDGDQTFVYELKKAAGLTGVVKDSAGKPAAGVTVYLATAGSNLQLTNGEVPEYVARMVRSVKTDAAGAFKLPPCNEAFLLVATGDAGIAQASGDSFKAGDELKLEAWATISGVAKIGSKPAANAEIQGWSAEGRMYEPRKPQLMSSIKSKTDADGHFSIEHVPPGKWNVGRFVSVGESMWTVSGGEPVTAAAGTKTEIAVGGSGRPVAGHVTIPPELASRADWRFDSLTLMTHMQPVEPPASLKDLQNKTPDERKAILESPEFKAYQAKAIAVAAGQERHRYSARVEADGAYRFDDVPPGTYDLVGAIQKYDGSRRGRYELLGRVTQSGVVVAAGDVDTAVEVANVAVVLEKK